MEGNVSGAPRFLPPELRRLHAVSTAGYFSGADRMDTQDRARLARFAAAVIAIALIFGATALVTVARGGG